MFISPRDVIYLGVISNEGERSFPSGETRISHIPLR